MLALTYKWSELPFNIPMTSCCIDRRVLVQAKKLRKVTAVLSFTFTVLVCVLV